MTVVVVPYLVLSAIYWATPRHRPTCPPLDLPSPLDHLAPARRRGRLRRTPQRAGVGLVVAGLMGLGWRQFHWVPSETPLAHALHRVWSGRFGGGGVGQAALGDLQLTSRTGASHRRDVEVPPDVPNHQPSRHLAEPVLTRLLADDDVAYRIAFLEKPAILDPAVELPEQPVVGPREIRDADQIAVLVEDLELKLRLRKVLGPHQVATEALTDRLCSGSGEAERDLKLARVRPAGPTGVSGPQRLFASQVEIEHRVQDCQAWSDRRHGCGAKGTSLRSEHEKLVLGVDVVRIPAVRVVDDARLMAPRRLVESGDMHVVEVGLPHS